MEQTAIGDAPAAERRGVERRSLGEALGTTDVALNRYVLEPGARIAGLHAHLDQAETFVVREGEVTFETLEGRVHVRDGEAVRFAPGEFQSATNAGDDEAALLALGAPKDTDAIRVPVGCPACDGEESALAFDGGESLVCPACGAERDPACPDCGGGDLYARLDDAGGAVLRVCRDCGAETPAR